MPGSGREANEAGEEKKVSVNSAYRPPYGENSRASPTWLTVVKTPRISADERRQRLRAKKWISVSSGEETKSHLDDGRRREASVKFEAAKWNRSEVAELRRVEDDGMFRI